MQHGRLHLLAFSLLFLTGCQDFGNELRPFSDQVLLARRDLTALSQASGVELPEFDLRHFGRFQQIFGGYTGEDLRRFLDQRIRHFVGWQDEIYFYPGKLSLSDIVGSKDNGGNGNPNVVTMASNLGFSLWLAGLIAEQKFSFLFQGGSFQVDSGRIGLVLLGEGYRESTNTSAGARFLPASFRHLTLMHEARHSDCTGGISVEQLAEMRKSRTRSSGSFHFRNRKCGHIHSRCPSGHEFEGLPACDDHPWGAYSIEAIYAEARAGSRTFPQSGTTDNSEDTEEFQNFQNYIDELNLLNTAAIDARSRLSYDYHRLLDGSFGDPNLSDSGLVDGPL